MAITVVGSVGYDSIKTPKDEREKILGGAAVHFSIAASIKSQVNFVGVAGDDFAKEDFELLKSRGIDLDGLEIVEGGKTFSWKAIYEKDMNQAITLETHLNVFESFDPKIPEKYNDCDFLYIANINPELQNNVLDRVSYKKASLLDTMNLWIDNKKEQLIEAIRKIDFLIINDKEIADLTGIDNDIKAVKDMFKLGVKYVIVKRGSNGAAMFGSEGFYFVMPANPIEDLVDPTGAGDSFAGGFVSYLDNSKSFNNETTLKKALGYATMVASFNVEGFGLERLSKTSVNEITARYKKYKEFVSPPDSI